MPDGFVALHGIWLVVGVGKDCVDPELRSQLRDCVGCICVQHDQRATALPQGEVELDDAAMKEVDAPIRGVPFGNQRVEDRAIENERAVQSATPRQSRRDGRVIGQAQVAPKPYQTLVVLHRCAGAVRCSLQSGLMSSEPKVPASLDLKHQFLIAMPAMADTNFERSVVYVCDHSDRGALGLVINRPTDLTLGKLFDRVDLKLEIAPRMNDPVYFGGPVQTERGFVLHGVGPADKPTLYSSTLAISDEISLTTSKDVLEAIAGGLGPDKVLVTLGYSGWGAGQLESEIAQNAWLTVSAAPQIIFDVPADEKYNAALRLLGVNSAQLAGHAGHA